MCLETLAGIAGSLTGGGSAAGAAGTVGTAAKIGSVVGAVGTAYSVDRSLKAREDAKRERALSNASGNIRPTETGLLQLGQLNKRRSFQSTVQQTKRNTLG